MESVQVETRACPRCNTPVAEQARFCARCGSAVGPAAKQTCANCRAPLDPTARFCPRCGTPAAGGRRVRRLTGAAQWEQARRRLEAIDWARVNRVVLPVTALLSAGLIGFLFGQQG